MREVIKEPLDVSIEHMRVPLPMKFQDFSNRHMTIAARPETIRVVVKHPLEERAQEEPKHLLSNPVADGGDPQRACLARTLGECTRRKGRGLKVPSFRSHIKASKFCSRLASNIVMLSLSIPQPPGSSDIAEGAMHQVQGDPSRQRMVLDLGHMRTFPVEPHETETREVRRRPVEAVS